MDLSTILMIVGIICIVFSFFLKDSSKKVEKDVEDLSISIYQETNAIKRRLKVVEEELLLEPNFQITSPNTTSAHQKNSIDSFRDVSAQVAASKMNPTNTGRSVTSTKPINEILVRQVIELNKQGYPISEIEKMSTLTQGQITTILQNNGGNLR